MLTFSLTLTQEFSLVIAVSIMQSRCVFCIFRDGHQTILTCPSTWLTRIKVSVPSNGGCVMFCVIFIQPVPISFTVSVRCSQEKPSKWKKKPKHSPFDWKNHASRKFRNRTFLKRGEYLNNVYCLFSFILLTGHWAKQCLRHWELERRFHYRWSRDALLFSPFCRLILPLPMSSLLHKNCKSFHLLLVCS